MRKKVCGIMLCVVLLMGAVASVSAQRGEWRGRIRSQIQAARDRIAWGVDQGTLTRREARQLGGELEGILWKIDAMRDDGALSRREREVIERDLQRLHRHITQEKQDDDTRRRRW